MKLLVVGHPFIVAYNQKKYVAMKHLDPALEMRIVGPRKVRHLFGTFPSKVCPELDPAEVIALASVFSRSHMTYLLQPARLAGILREFRPDVIHLEEEPHALVTLETLALRDLLAPRAAVTLFTWDNLHRKRNFPLGLLKKALRRYSLTHAAAVVCGNREAERLLRARDGYTGLCAVLPQFGLDPVEHRGGPEPELKSQLGLTGGIVVGYLGRLIPEKGIELLLGALAQLPDEPWKILLVGSGPLEREIHDRWIPRFPGRIVHLRAAPHSEVPRYLRCLDVFVLASYGVAKWKEQFGLTLAQAMMLGIPSVVSSSGAIPEVAGPGALIIEEGNQESLRGALRLVLASAQRRRELGERARAFAVKHYTMTTLASQYLEIFERARCLHGSTQIDREGSHRGVEPYVAPLRRGD